MSTELDALLRRTAPHPARPLDVDRLLQRAARRRRRHQVLVGAVALVMVAAVTGTLAVWTPTSVIFDRSQTPSDDDALPGGEASPPPSVPESADGRTSGHDSGAVTPLPPAPIDGRADAVAVWTGQEILVWGGWLTAEMGSHPAQVESGGMQLDDESDPIPIGDVHFDDGAAYDPAAERWRTIAAAPFSGGYGDRAVWTGAEMLVWSSREHQLAAYDPEADVWRALPDPPQTSGSPVVSMVWTGAEAILWGGADHQPELPPFGAAFDPAGRRWRALPDAPIPARQGHSATWTGEEMIVWGGSDLVGERYKEMGGAAYHPDSDSWRALALNPTGGREHHATAWDGREVLVWGSDRQDGLAYDPAQDAWRALPAAPVRARAHAIIVWTGDTLLVRGGSIAADGPDTAVYDPEADQWHAFPQNPLSDRCMEATAWTGAALFVWSGLPDCEVGMPPEDGVLIRVDDAVLASLRSAPEKTQEELPEGCRVLPEGERQVSESGPVGSSLGPTLLEGIHHGWELGPLAAVEADDPDFATPWHVIAAVVTDVTARELGTAVWLSPDPLATYAGGGTAEQREAWRNSPRDHPEATHLYAVDDLAAQISVWTPTDQRASTIQTARRCAQILSDQRER